MEWDVVIIGGGPAGSTTGGMLRRYDPSRKVLILERERFPRDHIGESLLPPISLVLEELGCWEKVERGGFPVKIGATYTWGHTTEPWVFGFIPEEAIPKEVERPGVFEGWRRHVAFQVDRSIYDTILVDHAASLGCVVRQETPVVTIHRSGDRIDGVELEGGEIVRGRWYIDASGNAAILRRAMEIPVHVPTALKNVAFWDYWTNDEWVNESDAKATRIHIRSLPYGWIWNIRLGPRRYSIGVVCNAEWYRQCGKKPAELYHDAVSTEPNVSKRLKGATARGKVEGTIDWSYVVDRTVGENWFLVGECAGFADPILSAGLTLTHEGARELAYTILEYDHKVWDRKELLDRFHNLQVKRVRQHMRFAEYWYSANGLFEDVRANCAKIAADAGLNLHPDDAFRWISFGGLGDEVPGQAAVGGYSIAAVKQMIHRFSGEPISWAINGKNTFKLNLRGAAKGIVGIPMDGRIHRAECWRRGPRTLVKHGLQGTLIEAMEQSSDIEDILRHATAVHGQADAPHAGFIAARVGEVLEVMVGDYWATASFKRGRPALEASTPEEGRIMFTAAKRPDARSRE